MDEFNKYEEFAAAAPTQYDLKKPPKGNELVILIARTA